MEYHDPAPIGRERVRGDLESNDPDRICIALISIGFHEADWEWAERTCLQFLSHPSTSVQLAAVNGLVQVAGSHGQLHEEEVLRALMRTRENAEIAGDVDEAISHIRTSLHGT